MDAQSGGLALVDAAPARLSLAREQEAGTVALEEAAEPPRRREEEPPWRG